MVLPVTELEHNFPFLFREDQSRNTMNDFELVIMDLLNLENLVNVVLVNLRENRVLFRVFLAFSETQGF